MGRFGIVEHCGRVFDANYEVFYLVAGEAGVDLLAVVGARACGQQDVEVLEGSPEPADASVDLGLMG
jgi:hypothetical protein